MRRAERDDDLVRRHRKSAHPSQIAGEGGTKGGRSRDVGIVQILHCGRAQHLLDMPLPASPRKFSQVWNSRTQIEKT